MLVKQTPRTEKEIAETLYVEVSELVIRDEIMLRYVNRKNAKAQNKNQNILAEIANLTKQMGTNKELLEFLEEVINESDDTNNSEENKKEQQGTEVV